MAMDPSTASFRAIARATGTQARLEDYQVKSVTLGRDAQGRVTMQCTLGGSSVRGQGVSTDIVEASGLAFVDAINRALRAEQNSIQTAAVGSQPA